MALIGRDAVSDQVLRQYAAFGCGGDAKRVASSRIQRQEESLAEDQEVAFVNVPDGPLQALPEQH